MSTQASYHIEDINGLGDLQIDWKFEIKFTPNDLFDFNTLSSLIPNTGSPIAWNILNFKPTYGTNKIPLFTMYARSIDFPGRAIGTIEDEFQGWKTLFPGKLDFGNEVSVSFSERQDQGVLRVIHAWQELINRTTRDSSTASFQYNANFKRACCGNLQVTMCSTNGKLSNVSGYFHNVWPSNRNAVNLDMTSEDAVKPDIDFTFDWSEIAAYK